MIFEVFFKLKCKVVVDRIDIYNINLIVNYNIIYLMCNFVMNIFIIEFIFINIFCIVKKNFLLLSSDENIYVI